MGARDREKESFDRFVIDHGAELVGRADTIEHGGAEYRAALKKIMKMVQELAERSGTGSDWVLCELFTVFGIDASIKIRYGRKTAKKPERKGCRRR